MKCIDCKYFDEISHPYKVMGYCKRRCPSFEIYTDTEEATNKVFVRSQSSWPRVVSDDWCGEFEEKKVGQK